VLDVCALLPTVAAGRPFQATIPDTNNMRSFFLWLRGFGTPGLCTVVSFAIAAWFPNDVIDLANWLLAVFLGLPVAILTRGYVDRSAVPTDRRIPAGLTLARRVFGALSVLLGVGVLGWLAYDSFARRLTVFTGLAAIAQAVLVIALIVFGYRLLRRPFQVERSDHDAAQEAHQH
jgi:hypothetical protein